MSVPNLASAVSDFRKARAQATLEKLVARIKGQSIDLLSYEEVRQSLKAVIRVERGLREIPLDAIVGSVDRYTDFTRTFLPREATNEQRWARVEVAMTGLEGLPPIEVYQIGSAYFVKDGNHRVSVARQLGATYIEAYVTEVKTKVSLSPDVQPDTLIIKAEYVAFLEHTKLDETRPEADLTVTAPGKYPLLEEHIAVHQYFMGVEQNRAVSYPEAAAHWYDTFYRPVVQTIKAQGVLHNFPHRTETDLYLWLIEHQTALKEQLGWDVEPEVAAADLAAQHRSGLGAMLTRIGTRVLETVTPSALSEGPAPGTWREDYVSLRQDEALFRDILVTIDGTAQGWQVLDQALIIAQRERARVHGVHVASTENAKESESVKAFQSTFEHMCARARVPGDLAVAVGEPTHTITERARWVDLVVFGLNHPPGPSPLEKLTSNVHTLIQLSPRPMLVVPLSSTGVTDYLPVPLERVLLAYDGSTKAQEALFVATHLAVQWDAVSLFVLTIAGNTQSADETLNAAREYLEAHDVHATYLNETPPVAPTLLVTAEAYQCTLILMGGYGDKPVLNVVLGSTVDKVLRSSVRPVLICR